MSNRKLVELFRKEESISILTFVFILLTVILTMALIFLGNITSIKPYALVLIGCGMPAVICYQRAKKYEEAIYEFVRNEISNYLTRYQNEIETVEIDDFLIFIDLSDKSKKEKIEKELDAFLQNYREVLNREIEAYLY